MEMKWETILTKYIFKMDNKELKTSRLKVPGGWLVLHMSLQLVCNVPIKSDAMSFVPDPEHKWEIT